MAGRIVVVDHALGAVIMRVLSELWEELRPSVGEERRITFAVIFVLSFLVLAVGIMKATPLLLGAALAGIAVVAFFFSRPAQALLYLFAFRLVLDLLWWLPGKVLSMNLMEIYTGGVTGLAAILFVLELRRVDRHPCMPAFLPYVLVLLIGGLRNLEVRSAAEILAKYINPLLMMFLVSAFVNTREDRRRFARIIAMVSVIPVMISLHHLVTGHGSSFMLSGYKRLLGGYQNLHNHALMMMAFSALLIWWTLVVSDKRERLVTGGMAVIAMLCLYQTYVRTAWLALAVFGAVLLWASGRQRILVMGGLIGLVFVSFTPAVQDRFKDLVLFFLPNQEVMSRAKLGSGRMGIWTASIREYLSYGLGDVVLGLGIGKHWLLTREAFNPYTFRKGGQVDAHSDYLTMTFQVGPIATLSYIVMQFHILRCGFVVFKRSPDPWARQFGAYTIGMCVAATAANMVSNAFINRATLGWFFWALAGLMFAEYQQLRREGLIDGRPSHLRTAG
jgi:hypothetical protein